MANNFAAFFETLVAGADEYNKAKVGRTALLDAVYKDIKPEAARIGKTVDVYFPDVGPLQAINNGILTATTVNPNYIPLVFQTRAGAALQFQDFEQWQTAVDLAQKFFDPLYKRAREYLNGQIAALITPANFNSNAPIIGATQGEVTVTDQLNAWDVAGRPEGPPRGIRQAPADGAQQRVPQDARRLGLGAGELGFARRSPARPASPPTWRMRSTSSRSGISRCRRRSGSILYGQVTRHRQRRPTVTGLNTAFTQQLTAGTSYLTFGNEPTKTQYKVCRDHQRHEPDSSSARLRPA